MNDAQHPDIAEALAGERALLEPAVRASRAEAAAFLDPEFTEVGASGRRWTYEEMIASLPEMTGATEDGPHIQATGFTGTLLAPGVVHLRYETTLDGLRVRRSSLWRRDPENPLAGPLRMYYHQGTPVPEARPHP
ncbi:MULTISPECIES: DUF4440 domain-containing protein [unclassified Streptomyces]|uniref:nuclear transport factor 2 family protein n=1 Tax=unclassified Streptomyces TaxID=2593676 RepID=UPI0036CC63C8